MPRVPVQVRTAVDDDLPTLRLVAARSFDRERLHRAGVVDLLFARPGVDPALRLVAVLGDEAVGFLLASVPPGPAGATEATGHLDALAVAPHARRQGVATALLVEARVRLVAAGCRWTQAGGSPWAYAWPGVDVAYTAALVVAERAGFVQQALAHDMDVDLADWVPGRGPAWMLGPAVPTGAPPSGGPGGTLVRRAAASDAPALRDLVAAHFTAAWEHELRVAVDRERPTAFVAERAGRVVGFAAHGVYRADAFGPLGTDPGERGSGVGAALLRACLDDMAAAGLSTARISWVGPAGFYSRTVGARTSRSYAVLRAPLAPAGEDGA